MRDYILNQAAFRETIGLRATAKRILRNWKHARQLRQLLAGPDYLLADVGLTRPMLQHLLDQSPLVDLDWERERILWRN